MTTRKGVVLHEHLEKWLRTSHLIGVVSNEVYNKWLSIFLLVCSFMWSVVRQVLPALTLKVAVPDKGK